MHRVWKGLCGTACVIVTFSISNPIQCGLLALNIILLRSASRARRRARFTATVRAIKDMTPEDVEYLIGRLPPWVKSPDWERCQAGQVLLGLLWPALNSSVCSLLKQELEERVQESGDFGHIAFSRISFGRHPPVVAGIKAVPLHSEDLLAMVLDVDVRWAGEPDIVLQLTKLGGASLGLSDVHLAGILRLIFTPITEDPPFLSRMSISLLHPPHVDFSIRVLGGPDIMALPAISSWLHSLLQGAAAKAIVWPNEVVVSWAPKGVEEDAAAVEAAAAALAPPPLGLLVVRVISADIELRRSTFLGRLKLPSPRVSLVLPEGPASGGTSGVMQAGLTAVQEKTLQPEWSQQFVFAITHPAQHLRLLLTHKRMELLGADMPLGAADLPMEEILAEYTAGRFLEELGSEVAAAGAPAASAAAALVASAAVVYGNGTSSAALFAATSEGFASASSSPVRSRSMSPTRHLAGGSSLTYAEAGTAPWTPLTASPMALRHRGSSPSQAALPLSDSINGDSSFRHRRHFSSSEGLGVLLDGTVDRRFVARAEAIESSAPWTPQGLSFAAQQRQQERPTTQEPAAAALQGHALPGWLSPGGFWVDVPACTSMTMPGMVASAAEPREELKPPPPLPPTNEQRSWMRSLKTLWMGSGGREEEEEEEEDDDNSDDEAVSLAEQQTVGRVRLEMQWLPIAPPIAPDPSIGGSSDSGTAEIEAAPPLPPASNPRGRPSIDTSLAQSLSARSLAPQPEQAGVLAVRVAYTKVDYGESPDNPILSVSTITAAAPPTSSAGKLSTGAPSPVSQGKRVICMDSQAGGRPGLLHWGRVFYLPVWDAASTRARVELGGAVSSLKLTSYGATLYSLDACDDFEADVAVEACTDVSLKEVVSKRVVRGTWRLREARSRAGANGRSGDADEDGQLDVGRVALVMAWYPLTE